MKPTISPQSLKVSGILVCLLYVGGCSNTSGIGAGVVGDKPGSVAPRLVKSGVSWDNPELFGKIPEKYQAEGDQSCRQQGMAKAIGYHPKAVNLDGKEFENGAFFCVPSATAVNTLITDAPSSTAPKLVRNSHPEGTGWDNPSAFGKVPANLQKQGDLRCLLGNKGTAIGYHPAARGLNGQILTGGGFFCAEKS